MTEQNHALEQAKAQAASIIAMVGALNVDYDRLEELKDERDGFVDPCADELAPEREHTIAWAEANPEDAEELAALEEAANGNDSEDEAREAIQNDALYVQVRSDWHAPGGDNTPSEFQILLCTGGPAVRIVGELNEHCEPSRAWIEYQDWGTPWTQAFGVIDQDTLLTYCQQFYFGE